MSGGCCSYVNVKRAQGVVQLMVTGVVIMRVTVSAAGL
jgi:hypothetical protein